MDSPSATPLLGALPPLPPAPEAADSTQSNLPPAEQQREHKEEEKRATNASPLASDDGWSPAAKPLSLKPSRSKVDLDPGMSPSQGDFSMKGEMSKGSMTSKRTKSLKRAVSLKEKADEKIQKIDAFATKMVESSMFGGFITVLVWMATIAYIVLLVVQWVQEPPTKTVGTEWTIGVGPFPMTLTCKAKSGCLLSNVLSKSNTLGISTYVTPAQTVCFPLAYDASIVIDMVYSVDPNEGLSVMWDPTTTTNTTSLAGGGITIASEIRCPNNQDPSCVMILQLPYPPGTALLQYVQTTNDSASGVAQNRNEWFGNMINQDGSVMPATTPCYNPSQPDPRYTSWVQCRVRMNSFYNTVLVTKDSFWLFLFGSAGGAYALFLQVGALLLALTTFSYTIGQQWAAKRRAAQGGVWPEPESNTNSV